MSNAALLQRRGIAVDALAQLFQQLNPELIRAEACRRSLHRFYTEMWAILEPNTPFMDNWHIGAIAEHLQAQSMGQIEKLLINIPFRQGKSLLTDVAWPAWEWCWQPSTHWLFMSYAATLTHRDSLKCRDVIESPWYQRRWGHVYRLSDDQNAKGRYTNTARGQRVASSFEGLGTGEGGNRIVMDDPHNMKEIHSETIRKETIRVWKEALSSRRNNPTQDTYTLIMQRGHEEDLSGYVLANEEGWEHLCLPMRYEPKRYVWFRTPDGKKGQKEVDVKKLKTKIGFVDPRKKEGELLHPQRFPAKTVADLELSLGSYGASGQLQQRPSPGEGGIFKRKHWKFYGALPQLDETIITVDAAFKDFDESDKVAIQAWGRKGADCFLRRRMAENMGFSATCDAIIAFKAEFPKASAILIEDKANGSAIIETMRKKIPGIIAIEPEGGKVARAYACQPMHEAGNVWLPDPLKFDAPWVNQFMELLGAFPNVLHDDEVDAMTQALNWINNRIGAQGMLDYMRGMAVDKAKKEEEQKEEQIRVSGGKAFMSAMGKH